MKLLNGLTEGQVLQRIGKRGAEVTLEIEPAEKGSLYATIKKAGRALPKWKRRVLTPARGRDGTVRVKLSGIPAGGPYHLQLECGRERLVVRSFYVGDVWILAGQSNMEGVGDMPGRAKPHPLIRSFSMRREWRAAAEPLFVLGESPDSCHHRERQLTVEEAEHYRRTTKKGSGVGLAFAHEMLRRSGVPQGLMCVAHGGTSMAQWNPALRDEGGRSLYGSMMLSVRACGQPVAGVLWYQGESDAAPQLVPLYRERMRALVAATQRDFKQPVLPWIVVQLARAYGNIEPDCWNRIQEEQRLLPSHIRNLETVVAVDLAMDDQIHVGAAGFPILAARLARAADRLVYGNRREQRPPQLRRIIAPKRMSMLSLTMWSTGCARKASHSGFPLSARRATCNRRFTRRRYMATGCGCISVPVMPRGPRCTTGMGSRLTATSRMRAVKHCRFLVRCRYIQATRFFRLSRRGRKRM